jgi:hypothetical protein
VQLADLTARCDELLHVSLSLIVERIPFLLELLDEVIFGSVGDFQVAQLEAQNWHFLGVARLPR